MSQKAQGLSGNQANYFRGLLTEIERTALQEIQLLSDGRRQELDLSQNGQHSDDRLASHIADPSAAEKLISKNRNLIDRIRKARKRLDAGTYGVCSACGEAIDEDRLKAKPIAKLCFDCKESEERQEQRLKKSRGTGSRHLWVPAWSGF